MNKILIVFGTRPEAIKMAPIVLALKKEKEVTTEVCVTGQHQEMLYGVLDLFNIKPDYDLKIMNISKDLFDITTNILIGMREVLNKSKPNIVIVHGDTTTSMAAAVSAFYYKIKICHVEAGLRTNDIFSPWPEEANRAIISRLASLHFAPTYKNQENLIAEGIDKKNIIITGNTVIDALYFVVEKLNKNPDKRIEIEDNIKNAGYKFSKNKVVLITGHRRENFGEGFVQIFSGIKRLGYLYPDIDFVYPVHLNPQVLGPANVLLNDCKNVYLIRPVEYENFVYLMTKSIFIITDSGGIQEEAPSLGKPVLVTRRTTERQEGINSGIIKLVGTDADLLVSSAIELIQKYEIFESGSNNHNLYGEGKSANLIVSHLINKLVNI